MRVEVAVNQGIINSTETETFAKACKLAKLLRQPSRRPCGTIKKSTSFSCMSISLNLRCFGALLQDNMGKAFRLCVIIHIINLLTHVH